MNACENLCQWFKKWYRWQYAVVFGLAVAALIVVLHKKELAPLMIAYAALGVAATDWKGIRERSTLIAGIAQECIQDKVPIYRLPITNVGPYIARSVQISVERISVGGAAKPGFVPAALRWTYLNEMSRDIMPNQTVYIDICEFRQCRNSFALTIPVKQGGASDVFDIDDSTSEVSLRYVQRTGVTGLWIIKLELRRPTATNGS